MTQFQQPSTPPAAPPPSSVPNNPLANFASGLVGKAKLYLAGGAIAMIGAIAFAGFVQITHKIRIIVDNAGTTPLVVKAYGVALAIEAGKSGVLEIGSSGEGVFEATGGKAPVSAKMSLPRFKLMPWFTNAAYVYISDDSTRTIAMVPMSYGTAGSQEPQIVRARSARGQPPRHARGRQPLSR